MATLNMAKSRVRPSSCNLVRTDQTCFGRSGGLAPINLPLFQAMRWGGTGESLAWSCSSVTEGDHDGPGVERACAAVPGCRYGSAYPPRLSAKADLPARQPS